jgi:hypothetical protein
MMRSFAWSRIHSIFGSVSVSLPSHGAIRCAAALLFVAGAAHSQVVIVDTRTGTVTNGTSTVSTVDRSYRQIEPTKVPLTNTQLDAKTRLELIRLLQSEQGFAMRPFPRGHKGLTLVANGKLEPSGEKYLEMVIKEGLSAKPSERLVLSDIKIERDKIVIDLNGGPDAKHRFLSHVQIGVGANSSPVAKGDDKEPTGSRLTLTFEHHVPVLTASEVKALLAPLISFDLKTPIQAFTDTLPPKLKDAILNHQVLVGMTTEMVLFSKGQPVSKTRETEGQMPFEEWIYGQPPKDVEFVRVNGNRVIRYEVAKMGETPVVYTQDEVEGLMRTDGTPLETASSTTRTVAAGDAVRDPDTQSPAAPPSLRKTGEKLPTDDQTDAMKPVRFPTAKPDAQQKSSTPSQTTTQLGANPDEEPTAPQTTSGAASTTP